MIRNPIPLLIGRANERDFLIKWDDAGHEGIYSCRTLRLACPCAECREEMTGHARLDPASVPEDIYDLRVSLVGQYGIRIDWSDGHNTGIYTYEHLLALCPCANCRRLRADEGGQA